MVSPADLHVIVAGAGVGGAAAALVFAGAGARVTLLERVVQPREVGAGILLQANGLAVLYGLGLRDALQQHAHHAFSFRIQDAAGRTISTSPAPDFGAGLAHTLVLRRSDLLTVLLDAVQAHPNITTRFGTEVTAARRDGTITYRTPFTTAELSGDLVIGADGVHSRVRADGDFGARVMQTGTWYVRALSPLQIERDDLTEAWTPLGIFGMARAGAGGTYFFTSAWARPLAQALARRDLPAFGAAWARAYPPAAPLLGSLQRFDDLLVNEVIRVDCKRMVAGRLALLGDAAHAMHPNLGQGANSALVDAAVLLDEIVSSGSVGEALARYDLRRRAAVRRVQDNAALFSRISDIGNMPLRWGRDNIVRVVTRLLGGERAFREVQQEDPAALLALVRKRTGTETDLTPSG